MLKIIIFIFITIVILIVNRIFTKRKKYFFQMIPLVRACIITIISIVEKENEYSMKEVQTVQSEESMLED